MRPDNYAVRTVEALIAHYDAVFTVPAPALTRRTTAATSPATSSPTRTSSPPARPRRKRTVRPHCTVNETQGVGVEALVRRPPLPVLDPVELVRELDVVDRPDVLDGEREPLPRRPRLVRLRRVPPRGRLDKPDRAGPVRRRRRRGRGARVLRRRRVGHPVWPPVPRSYAGADWARDWPPAHAPGGRTALLAARLAAKTQRAPPPLAGPAPAPRGARDSPAARHFGRAAEESTRAEARRSAAVREARFARDSAAANQSSPRNGAARTPATSPARRNSAPWNYSAHAHWPDPRRLVRDDVRTARVGKVRQAGVLSFVGSHFPPTNRPTERPNSHLCVLGVRRSKRGRGGWSHFVPTVEVALLVVGSRGREGCRSDDANKPTTRPRAVWWCHRVVRCGIRVRRGARVGCVRVGAPLQHQRVTCLVEASSESGTPVVVPNSTRLLPSPARTR